ncbi:MAG: hypothetical protein V1926_02620 [Candidatus Peregrinibacteria bacterium]
MTAKKKPRTRRTQVASAAPLTKSDLIAMNYATKSDLVSMNYVTKSDLQTSNAALHSELKTTRDEIFAYIDLKLEQLVHDFRGIFSDRTAQQGEKIQN